MDFPRPEVGLGISYSYLWSDEAEAGHVEGRKNRPCAIVLVVQQAEGAFGEARWRMARRAAGQLVRPPLGTHH